MAPVPSIRQLYQPVQPTVKQTAAQVSYVELLPDPALQNYIYCYWQLHTSSPLQETFHYRVVADGCMDIFFELHQPQESFVMGFSSAYTAFPLSPTFHYIGIRFFPAAFPLLFNIAAAELTNRFETLSVVLPDTARFIASHFHPALTTAEIKHQLDQHFLPILLQKTLQQDRRFFNALHTILEQQGIVNIEKELATGISNRQLRRLFEHYIGDSAKTFSKVVRFQHILHSNPSPAYLRKHKIFFDAGYYDQAHFIKEFKTLFGLTPTQAFEQ